MQSGRRQVDPEGPGALSQNKASGGVRVDETMAGPEGAMGGPHWTSTMRVSPDEHRATSRPSSTDRAAPESATLVSEVGFQDTSDDDYESPPVLRRWNDDEVMVPGDPMYPMTESELCDVDWSSPSDRMRENLMSTIRSVRNVPSRRSPVGDRAAVAVLNSDHGRADQEERVTKQMLVQSL